MEALDRSKYDEIVIESVDGSKTVDIAPGTVMIDYYEDIFSPTLTAKLQVTSEGNTITGEDGELQSVYNGLPLRGGETVTIKISGNSDKNPGIDLSFFVPHSRVWATGLKNVSRNKVLKTSETTTGN